MLTENSLAEQIWNYLIQNGLTAFGAAGLMGNLYAESGLIPNRVEILCLKRLAQAGRHYTDAAYTAFVDDGTIPRSEFLNPLPGKQYGYGLAQWTSPGRKAGLYDLCRERKVSIGDLEAQLDWLMSELGSSYGKVLAVLKTAGTVKEASDFVLTHFEQPADCGAAVKTYRMELGQKYYDRFGGNAADIDAAIKRVTDIAVAELGYLEKKSTADLDDKTANAGSANFTKYWRDLYPAFQGQAWCAIFVAWCFVQAFGLETAKKLLKHWPFTYCPTLAGMTTNKTPKVGSVVLFYRNGTYAHTGLVVAVTSITITTIEGNTSGASGIVANGGGVCRKTYRLNDLDSNTKYFMPDYSLVGGKTDTKIITEKSTREGTYVFEVGTVQNGSKGKDVKLLQGVLNMHGANLAIDGECGPKTAAAIKKYQKDFGLAVDGICGPKTWAALLMKG